MCTLTEKAKAYIATLPTEERFAALRGFFAGAEAILRNSFADIENNGREWFKECEAFKASDYRQAKPAKRSTLEAGASLTIPLDAWTRL